MVFIIVINISNMLFRINRSGWNPFFPCSLKYFLCSLVQPYLYEFTSNILLIIIIDFFLNLELSNLFSKTCENLSQYLIIVKSLGLRFEVLSGNRVVFVYLNCIENFENRAVDLNGVQLQNYTSVLNFYEISVMQLVKYFLFQFYIVNCFCFNFLHVLFDFHLKV